MIVEYHHGKYELDGQIDTDNYAAYLLFALREDAPDLSDESQRRFLANVGKVALFDGLEVIGSGVIVTGAVIMPPVEEFYKHISASAVRILGPEGMKPDNLLRGFTTGKLQQIAGIASNEFETAVSLR